MSYHDTVSSLREDPGQLEKAYHAAVEAGEAEDFKQAIDDSHSAEPGNLLYGAWFHRLRYTAEQVKRYVVAWPWAIPLAAVNGLLFWWLSSDRFMVAIRHFQGTELDFMPAVILLAGPLAAVFVLAYTTGVSRRSWGLSALIGILLLAAAAYVLLIYPQAGSVPFQEQYLTLMAMHLPVLAWSGVGVALLAKRRDPTNHFSFLIKSLEVLVVGGLLVAAGGLLTAITIGLFGALNVQLPELVKRLFIAGGGGLITVLATAVMYDPTVPPAEQTVGEGLGKLVALLMRILLPLTLLVLLVYTAFIPFNFRAPLDNREVLIVFNGMLFAVIALLASATPVRLSDISPSLARWLRRGIAALAALALIIGIYALVAILYRTVLDRLTPNRLTFIGWNVVNIGLLGLLLGLQARAGEERWLDAIHRTCRAGTIAYAVWTAAMILLLPWVFGIDQGAVEDLPTSVQEIVHEHPAPILLKCTGSAHVYLLDKGEKRWIDTIETFDHRGYAWGDVHDVTCDALRSIPDGEAIPADSGPPPQP
jgi:hypothetical protein